jgi:hypothetical protein
MTNENVIESNKIIAKFMGEKLDPSKLISDQTKGKNLWVDLVNMNLKTDISPYNLSYDWLMPVIEKISKLQFQDGEYVYPRTFGMINKENGKFMFRFNRYRCFEGDTLIEAAYDAVIDYLHYIK